MFELKPFFFVVPLVAGRTEPLVLPYMAIAEVPVEVLSSESYLCRLSAAPGLPGRWCEALLRLEGVRELEDGTFDTLDKIRAEAVKSCAERYLRIARRLTLRDFRRDEFHRLVVDVHTDLFDLSALLTELVRLD